MKKLFFFFAVSLVCCLSFAQQKSGPYRVTGVSVDEMPGYYFVYPEDIKSAVAIEGPLPVVLFGHGGCAEKPSVEINIMNYYASNGYVAVSSGRFPDQKVLDWLQKQNATPGSAFYSCVDVERTCASGYSCGGLQALMVSTRGDSRIKTTMLLCSGVQPNDSRIGKDALKKLNVPILYINGGPDDIAYKNGADDYRLIDNVPVTSANLSVGHGGTFSKPNGGQFGIVSLRWLDWRLKGHTEYEDFFRYGKLENGFEGWTIRSKNYSKYIQIDLPGDVSDVEEKADVNLFGDVENYTAVTKPFIKVSLPDADKATGTAVLLFPGGGLSALSWDSDFRQMAQYLNARGVAAIGVKYRLRVPGPRPAAAPAPRPAAPAGGSKIYTGRAQITDFGEIVKANTAPSPDSSSDPFNQKIIEDANNAMRVVREHAAEWNIDPDKVGYMGFSAGGCVELAALTHCDDSLMPNFVASVYGPSMMDVDVPANAPRLFIAVHADHPNVAAGCLALFLEWKKAGVDAELHVYGEGTGGLFGGGGWKGDRNTLNGSWLEAFYSWLLASGF